MLGILKRIAVTAANATGRCLMRNYEAPVSAVGTCHHPRPIAPSLPECPFVELNVAMADEVADAMAQQVNLDDAEDASEGAAGEGSGGLTKNQKKKLAKKKAAARKAENGEEGGDATDGAPPASQGGGGGGGGKKKKGKTQTDPPTIPVAQLYTKFPEGEWQSYKDDQRWRETDAEKRELQRLEEDMLNDVRQCAEVHRQV